MPDRFTVNLNYRYAPDKSPAEAEDAVRAAVTEAAGTAVELTVSDHAPAGRPARDDAYVAAFTAATGATVGPKQAWTDVGRLSAAGVPALNFGPGLTAQAHQAGEHVPLANLAAGRAALVHALGALPGGRYT